MKTSDPQSSARAIIGFLIVILAFTILVLFQINKDNIFFSGNIYPFVILVFIGSALLLVLLFFVNQPQAHKKIKNKSKKR